MRLRSFTPRFQIVIDDEMPHRFETGIDGCTSIDATASGVVVEWHGRRLLLTDQGAGEIDGRAKR